MNSSKPTGIGVIGAGVISTQYLTTMSRSSELDVRFIADLDTDRAREQAQAFDIPGFGSVDELLDDPAIEIVVNLTIPAVHSEVGLRVIAAGKHVWSEKPLALDRTSGRELLAAAEAQGLHVVCAPDTFLGGGLQTAQRAIARGDIGTPLSAISIFETRGPDRWHPNPDFLFAQGAGPLYDMAPYYLTALIQNLGPVASVVASAAQPRSERHISTGPRAGETFLVHVPTRVTASVDFDAGAQAQMIWSWDSGQTRSLLEITGTEGTLQLPNPNNFTGNSTLWRRDADEPLEIASSEPERGRGAGVLDLVRSLRDGTQPRASGELALHVLDTIVAIDESAAADIRTPVTSSAAIPSPLPEDWQIN